MCLYLKLFLQNVLIKYLLKFGSFFQQKLWCNQEALTSRETLLCWVFAKIPFCLRIFEICKLHLNHRLTTFSKIVNRMSILSCKALKISIRLFLSLIPQLILLHSLISLDLSWFRLNSSTFIRCLLVSMGFESLKFYLL